MVIKKVDREVFLCLTAYMLIDGQKIKELREATGLSQVKFAAEYSISRPTLIKAEKGENIGFETLRVLAEALGVQPRDLMI